MNVANNTVKTHIYSAFQKSYGTRLKELRKLSPTLLHFKINTYYDKYNVDSLAKFTKQSLLNYFTLYCHRKCA